jgi:ubiquinone/menaquinone biosynthesis C-methylase UbiE
MNNETKYTYGNDIAAADRLKVIADFFNPHASKYIKEYVPHHVSTAIDLGCGPGYTTDMLRCTLFPDILAGIDNSEQILKLAKIRFPELQFIKYDALSAPFPIQPNLIYCRFLLSHIRDIENAISLWFSQLSPEGILILEEFEKSETSYTFIDDYIKVNSELIASQGACLHVGKLLKNMALPGIILDNNEYMFPVNDFTVGRWLYPNTVSIWKNSEFIQNRYNEVFLNEVGSELKKLIESESIEIHTSWFLRKIVIKKIIRT